MSVNWALFGRINQVAEEPGARKLNQEYRSTMGLASRYGSTVLMNLPRQMDLLSAATCSLLLPL